jgi:hypothetical protein
MFLPAYIIDELRRQERERERKRREELRIEAWDPELCPCEEPSPCDEPRGTVEVDFEVDCYSMRLLMSRPFTAKSVK